LIFATNYFKENGIEGTLDKAGEHDPANPEGSILLALLAEQIKKEGLDPKDLDLVEMTKVRTSEEGLTLSPLRLPLSPFAR
jgi:hypothetical protein